MRSADGGLSWSDVTPPWLQADAAGDPVVYRDPLSDRVFVTGYNGRNYSPLQWTDDGGATWFTAPPVVGLGATDYPCLWSVPAGDAPTVDYPSVLFLCYFSILEQQCRRSHDGGLTWDFAASPFLPTTSFNFKCGWRDGRVAGSAHDDTLYMPFILQAEAATPEGYVACNDPAAPWGPLEVWVSVSRDLRLSWQVHRVEAGFGDDVLAAAAVQLRVAVDAAGNAYLLFVGPDSLPRHSVSRDHGDSWSEPVNVAAPGVTAVNLPSLAAGDEGRIAFFYVASTVPGGFDALPEVMAEATWHGYAGFSLDALADEPVFATTLTSDPSDPLRRGPCEFRCILDPDDCVINCDIGSPANGMYDYTNTKLNPATGQAWNAFVDLCADACAAPGANASAGGSFRGAVGVQTGGTLILSPVPATQVRAVRSDTPPLVRWPSLEVS